MIKIFLALIVSLAFIPTSLFAACSSTDQNSCHAPPPIPTASRGGWIRSSTNADGIASGGGGISNSGPRVSASSQRTSSFARNFTAASAREANNLSISEISDGKRLSTKVVSNGNTYSKSNGFTRGDAEGSTFGGADQTGRGRVVLRDTGGYSADRSQVDGTLLSSSSARQNSFSETGNEGTGKARTKSNASVRSANSARNVLSTPSDSDDLIVRVSSTQKTTSSQEGEGSSTNIIRRNGGTVNGAFSYEANGRARTTSAYDIGSTMDDGTTSSHNYSNHD